MSCRNTVLVCATGALRGSGVGVEKPNTSSGDTTAAGSSSSAEVSGCGRGSGSGTAGGSGCGSGTAGGSGSAPGAGSGSGSGAWLVQPTEEAIKVYEQFGYLPTATREKRTFFSYDGEGNLIYVEGMGETAGQEDDAVGQQGQSDHV